MRARGTRKGTCGKIENDNEKINTSKNLLLLIFTYSCYHIH